MAPARSFQDEKMDCNACDAVRVDSLRTDTGTGIRRIDGAVGSDIRKCRSRRNTRTDFNYRADSDPGAVCHAHSIPGTDRTPGTDSDTHADTCPYAETHGSADNRTCPGTD